MAIARYEPVTINNVVVSTNALGEYTITSTPWFTTAARVHDVNSKITILDKYRSYSDITTFTMNFTPNMRTIIASVVDYSVTYNAVDWRISDAKESDDRMFIVFICYRNDPVVPV